MTKQNLNHHSVEPEFESLPPWMRPAEPDHPMIVEGDVIDGNTELMFRCMVEEYLLAGHGSGAIRDMCRQENYQAFYAAVRALGESRAESIILDCAARVGRHRIRFVESGAQAKQATLTVSAQAGQTAVERERGH